MPILHKARNPDLWTPQMMPRGRVRLDREHPLARGLLGVWFFGETVAPVNMVTGRPVTSFATNFTMGVSPFGRGARTEGSYVWNLGPCNTVYAANTTIGMVRHVTAIATNSAAFGDAVASDTGSCWLPFSGTIYWDFPDRAGGITATMPAAHVSGAMEAWVFHGGSAGRGIWRNGVAVSDVSSPTGTASPSATNGFTLNGHPGGSGIDQTMHLFCTWSRQLSASEIVRWSAEPFSFLLPVG